MEMHKISCEHGVGRLDIVEDDNRLEVRENYECPAAVAYYSA